MKLILPAILLFLSASAHAQRQPLSKSIRTSPLVYIYKINTKEAFTLYRSSLYKFNEKYLHTLVDSFPINAPRREQTDGNYLEVYADGNKLHYELFTAGDLQMKLVNNSRDLVVALHNKKGEIISNAAVSIKGKKLSYDPSTSSYRINRFRKGGEMQVIHNNTAYYFSVRAEKNNYSFWTKVKRKVARSFPVRKLKDLMAKIRNEKRSYYSNYFYYKTRSEENYRGYMVFSKPMYKPGDTVKMKAFVMTKKGHGIKEKLLLRITDEAFAIDTIIASVGPYRNGGYTYEFVLNDSLDLDLDENYLMTLEKQSSRKYDLNNYEGDDEDEYAGKRKVVMRGRFRYEEYELNSIKFSARADKKEHNHGEPVNIFLKATDENDLPVMDGRYEIRLITGYAEQVNTTRPVLFVPDTLWENGGTLEATGETKINIPDSVFPSATFNYRIETVLLNSNNERQTANSIYQQHFEQPEGISFTHDRDSLQIEYKVRGVTTKSTAVIYVLGKNDSDTIGTIQTNLPAAIWLNPYVYGYDVVAGDVENDFILKEHAVSVSALASRTKDSVFVVLNNPNRLPVWYTLFAGEKIVMRGHADSFYLNTKAITKKNYTISLQYIFGNRVLSDDYTIGYRDKELKLQLNAPPVISPGQEAVVEISVTDADNNPVANADVTSYAFTKKFEKAPVPQIPYLGKLYKYRGQGYNFSEENLREWQNNISLNWKRWSKELGLDTIEYYKFLYTPDIYRNEEKARDSITQVAPFVVVNGEVQPIHILYIDEKPVFFSKSQDLAHYSFRVEPGNHTLRIRTKKQLITLYKVRIPHGMKTILSISGDTSNKAVTIASVPDTLSTNEMDLLAKYTILVQNFYGEHFSYVEQDNKIFLLPRVPFESGISSPLIGPLSPHIANLVVHSQFSQLIDPEGGYIYQVRPGHIKQKELNTRRYIGSWLAYTPPPLNFSELVWTAEEIDSLWLDYLDRRSSRTDLFVNYNERAKGMGLLRLNVKNDPSKKIPEVKNIFLFKYDNTDFTRVYRGEERLLGYLREGLYRLIILFRGDRYVTLDSILVKKDGINFYEVNANPLHEKDSLSEKFARIIQRREIEHIYDTRALDSIRINYNDRFLDNSNFSNNVSGLVRDDFGNPIPFAAVLIKGTRYGVSTDARGVFEIRTPREGTLVFSAAGYESQEVRITSPGMYVALKRQSGSLQEVVVTALGIRKKKEELGYSTSIVTQLSGKVAGLIVRGNGTPSASDQLIVIDGVPFKGNVNDLDKSMIGMMTILKPEVGMALYGAAANNGAIVIVTKKQMEIDKAALEMAGTQNSIRRNFRDDAYWQPKLRTGQDGKVQFKLRFPDDITSWRNFAIAVTEKKQTGWAESMTKSFKPLSANLALPQFIVVGDSLNFISKTLNYGNEMVELKRRILIDGVVVKDGLISVKNSVIDTTHVIVPSKDSVRFQLEVVKQDGYFDGEQRSLPVFKQGVTESLGFFAALEGDSSVVVDLDPSLGKITMHAEASLFPALLDETEKLRNYEYLCNEQLASKLKALLMQKAIDSVLQQRFKNENAVVDIIAKLMAGSKNNLWGWWPNNDVQPWISLHVVEALLKAEKAGYKVGLQKRNIIDFLVFNMENYRGIDKLLSLHLLHGLDAKVDYAGYIDSIEAKMQKASLYEKLRLLEIKQKAGLKPVVDTLLKIAKHTMFGNLYWGEENYRMFDNSVQNTVLVYRLLKNAGDKKTLAEVRNYFLEKRKDGQWRNTYESSLILETILPDLFENGNPVQPASIRFQSQGKEVITRFPYHAEISGNERIAFRKEGGMPLYFTAYQTRWNPSPAKVADAFTVSSYFEKQKENIATLKAGEPVELKVRVDVKGDADFVMIEIPIPAGCSYKEKPQPWSNNEVHREYFKNKVSIFCSSLKQGTYTFSVPLLPRYTGRFQLNPAKAEMMYFPVFFGREGMKSIDIR